MTAGSRQRRWWPAVQFTSFFVVFFLYVWLWVDTTLLYYNVGPVHFPVFRWGSYFFEQFLRYPGGPVEYLSALLSQYYYYAWAGALIITAVSALLGLAMQAFMAAVVGRRVAAVEFVPAILVLAVCNRYVHKLAMLVALLAAMLAVCLYTRTMRRRSALRLAAFVALSGPLYYIAGGGAYLLYAALCGILEFRAKHGGLLGLCYLLLGEVIPYVFGVRLLDLSLADAYGRLVPFDPTTDQRGDAAALCLYLFPLLAGLVGLIRASVTRSRRAASGDRAEPTTESVKASRLGAPAGKRGFGSAALVAAVAVVMLLTFSTRDRTLLRIGRFAVQEMWPQVLREARHLRHDQFTFASTHAVNRALYETGRLPDEMFSYPQHPEWFMVGLNLGSRPPSEMYRLRMQSFFQLGDLELQLGLVNEEEHRACEGLEVVGEYPLILKRLALISVIKGQTEAAKVFLRALTRYMRYRGWAEEALRRLEADPLWSTDPEVQRIRSVMVRRKSAILDIFLENRLAELLRRNRHNRMAFEYRMAFYLVMRRLEKFAGELDRLDDFDYPEIPRHYQEAILVYEGLTGRKVELHGRQISPETRLAYEQFTVTFLRYHALGDREGGWNALAKRFGNTFFFYYSFGESGVGAG